MGLSLFFVCVFCVDPNKSQKNTSEKIFERKVYKHKALCQFVCISLTSFLKITSLRSRVYGLKMKPVTDVCLETLRS